MAKSVFVSYLPKKCMNIVFSSFTISLFQWLQSVNHWEIRFNFCLIVLSSSAIDVSSENITVQVARIYSGKTLIKRIKIRGPNTDPCNTPNSMFTILTIHCSNWPSLVYSCMTSAFEKNTSHSQQIELTLYQAQI